MNTELIKTVGKIAGIGGLALGVLLIVFREIIRKKIFPQLTKEQAYKLLVLIVVFVFIMAIVGIVAWMLGPKAPEPVADVKENLAECADLRVPIFPKIPFYLVHTIAAKERDFLYYARVKGTNNCKTKVHAKVKFYVPSPDFADIKKKKDGRPEGEWLSTTISPKETIDKDLRPEFEYFRPAIRDEKIRVEYIILTEQGVTIRKGWDDIEIISRNQVYWDLRGPSGNSVPPDFLLASLSAWWAVKDPLLEARGQQFLEKGGGSSSSQDWFNKCYGDLFDRRRPDSLKVNPYPESWPLKGKEEASQQVLCMPTEVVKGKIREIHSLEAALLMAALVNNLPERLVFRLDLWAVPDPQKGDAGVKRFLLAWSPDEQDWYALDLTDPNKSDFGENESQATATVRNLLQTRGEILRSLKEKGVFIEGGRFVQDGRQILAVDFKRASQCFSIRALP